MTEEEKEVLLVTQMLQKISSEAKTKSDLGINLIDRLSAKFDDHLSQQAFNEKVFVPSKSFLSLIKWSRKIPQSLNYGPPYSDVMTRNFIEQLGEKGEITRAQMRILNIYKMIRFESNGACSIISPSSKDFTKAKTMIGILLMVIPFIVMVVWEVSNCIYPGLPFGFLMGATLGLIWRDIYNFAWGREKLAIYISSKYLWLRREQYGLAR